MAEWRPYYYERSRKGVRRVKGVAIVYRCADIGLELKSALGDEWSREDLCKELCAALNQAFRKKP